MGLNLVYLLYTSIFVGFLGAGYFFARRYLFGGRSMVVLEARIDAIKIPKMGEFWSPEVIVDYHFFYLGEKYHGGDYIRLDVLLSTADLLLTDRHGLPSLITGGQEFIGEEHIEMYILDHTREIPIEFQASALPLSRIHKDREEKKTLFQNVSIDFPWYR